LTIVLCFNDITDIYVYVQEDFVYGALLICEQLCRNNVICAHCTK